VAITFFVNIINKIETNSTTVQYTIIIKVIIITTKIWMMMMMIMMMMIIIIIIIIDMKNTFSSQISAMALSSLYKAL
jgi:hypothetical protein